MNFTFENQGINTYLVYSIGKNDRLDTMSLGMLTNNKIPGLATTLFTQMDESKYIKYNVSSKIPVKQFFAGAVNKKRLLGVFSGIINAMISAEDYMIDVNTILLDIEYMFANVSSCETTLICLPILNNEIETINLGMFFKDIMFSTQFDQTENCDHVAKIINYLNSASVFSLSHFKSVIEEIKKETDISSVIKIQPINQQKTFSPTQSKVNTSVQKKPQEIPTIQKKALSVQLPVQTPIATQNKFTDVDEKQISFFYLMKHYNKENAALYKAQKAAKKGQQSQVQQPVLSTPDQKKHTPASFAVPGVSAYNTGFAIPGQPSPASAVQQKPQSNIQQQVSAKQSVAVGAATAQNIPQQPSVLQGQPMDFGETTVLGGGNIGETTVLNAGMQQAQTITPHLIRIKNNEEISLNKPVFRIGKEKSYVDYFIGDNAAISRSHANIITREGEYFATDTNSTNHTFVNGTMIQSNVESKISHGDKIRLANEDFEFKLY